MDSALELMIGCLPSGVRVATTASPRSRPRLAAQVPRASPLSRDRGWSDGSCPISTPASRRRRIRAIKRGRRKRDDSGCWRRNCEQRTAHRAVLRARGQAAAGQMRTDGAHAFGMLAKRVQTLAGLQRPHLRRTRIALAFWSRATAAPGEESSPCRPTLATVLRAGVRGLEAG